MKALVVYAHPNPKSFNHAVLEAFTNGLRDGGRAYEAVDLYAIKFDAVLKLEEFTGEQMPKEVLDQQEKVTKADVLVFICPVWWLGFPAILKGWIDRVFSYGFAYTVTETGKLEGLLKDKKALLINTTMFPEEYYKNSGLGDAIKKIADTNLKEYCGIQQVEYVFLYNPTGIDDEGRKKQLGEVYRLGKEL